MLDGECDNGGAFGCGGGGKVISTAGSSTDGEGGTRLSFNGFRGTELSSEDRL